MSDQTKYNKNIIWIHWISTLLVLGIIFTGINMEHKAVIYLKFNLYRAHFLMGITIFLLTIFRIYFLLTKERPKPLYPEKKIRQKFVNFVHYGFYVVILWMCISGFISLFTEAIFPALKSQNISDLPQIEADGISGIMLSHHLIAKIVFLLLIFHIGGTISYWINTKSNPLRRIL